MRRLSEAEKQAAIKAYQDGESIYTVASHYGCNPTNIYLLLRIRGIPTRSPKDAAVLTWKGYNREAMRITRRRHYDKCKAKGKCVQCGKRRGKEGTACLCGKCRQKQINKSAASHQRIKDEAFAAYGGYQCRQCPVTNPVILTLDHIDNDGAEHRKQLGHHKDTRKGGKGANIYRWLKKHGYPPIMQVLCFNCNILKEHKRKHQGPT